MPFGISNMYVGSSNMIQDAVVTDAKLNSDFTRGTGHVFISQLALRDNVVGTWSLVSSGSWVNHQRFNSTTAQNDEASCSIYLAAGTYKLVVLAGKNSNCAIVEFFLDATSLGTFDTYAAGAVSASTEITGITVSSAGIKTFRCLCGSKNASSSAYRLNFSGAVFQKTA